MAGDRIVSVDGKKVEYWEDIQRIIQGKKDVVRVKVSLQRNGKEFTLDVKISQKKVDDQLGQKRSVGLLGIKPKENEIVKVKRGIGKSFLFGAYKAWDLTLLTYKALWRMITGKLSIRESVTGPLGVFYITYQAAQLGIIPLLYLVAALNISLAIFNLLPLPVLDGGHLLLLGIEMVRRKSLGAKAERIITQAGLTLIISLAVIVTYNDIVRLFGDKIAKFFGY
jgi:regulator of sigma E protease